MLFSIRIPLSCARIRFLIFLVMLVISTRIVLFVKGRFIIILQAIIDIYLVQVLQRVVYWGHPSEVLNLCVILFKFYSCIHGVVVIGICVYWFGEIPAKRSRRSDDLWDVHNLIIWVALVKLRKFFFAHFFDAVFDFVRFA
jgi:hypothetical protein